jgi:hypothetical protein
MWNYWLFAGADFGDISRHARGSGSLGNTGFVIAVLFTIAALAGGLHYWAERRKNFLRNSSNPHSLFLELCHPHQLSRSERSLLLRAVEARGLSQPAFVFVDPNILGAIKQSPSPDSQAYAALADKLFGADST